MSQQITYKYLPPETEPTDDELSKAEPVSIQKVEGIGEPLRPPKVGEVVTLPDLRYGDEERGFRVVEVGRTTVTRVVEEPGTTIENVNVYVSDPE